MLEALTCPTLVVQGAADPLGPVRTLERLAARNARLELTVLAGATHSFGRREREAVETAASWLGARMTAASANEARRSGLRLLNRPDSPAAGPPPAQALDDDRLGIELLEGGAAPPGSIASGTVRPRRASILSDPRRADRPRPAVEPERGAPAPRHAGGLPAGPGGGGAPRGATEHLGGLGTSAVNGMVLAGLFDLAVGSTVVRVDSQAAQRHRAAVDELRASGLWTLRAVRGVDRPRRAADALRQRAHPRRAGAGLRPVPGGGRHEPPGAGRAAGSTGRLTRRGSEDPCAGGMGAIRRAGWDGTASTEISDSRGLPCREGAWE